MCCVIASRWWYEDAICRTLTAVCFAGEMHINECRGEGKPYRLIEGATDSGLVLNEGKDEQRVEKEPGREMHLADLQVYVLLMSVWMLMCLTEWRGWWWLAWQRNWMKRKLLISFWLVFLCPITKCMSVITFWPVACGSVRIPSHLLYTDTLLNPVRKSSHGPQGMEERHQQDTESPTVFQLLISSLIQISPSSLLRS